MSLQFTQATQVASFRSISLSLTGVTVTGRVRLDATNAAARTIMSLHTTNNDVLRIDCDASGALWTIDLNFGATTLAMQGAGVTQSQGFWYDVALVGVSSSGNKIRAYIRPPGESLAREYEVSNPASGTYNHVFLGSPYTGYQALMTWSNVKVFSAALTKTQIETEFSTQTVADTTNRVCYAPLTGSDITAVTTSSYGSGGFASLVATDAAGTTASLPVRSASEPSWASADFVVATVSSPIALPDEAPSTSGAIAVVQSAIATSRGEAPLQSVTLASVGYNNVAVAAFGGWTDNPSSVSITDSLGLTWTQRFAKQYNAGGSGAHVVVWTAPITSGAGALTVTPVVTGATAAPWVSIALLEVARANLSTLIDGTPVSNSGSGTTASADHASTTNANDLMISALSYGSSTSAVSSWNASYSKIIEKSGESGLSVATRAVTSTGDYDPSATLAVTTPWVAGVLAMRQQASATAPSITTTSIASQPSATAGAVQLAATGSGPITWSQIGAPSSVTLSAGGYLSWPSSLADGSYALTATAKNDNGTATQSLTLTIASTATAPSISTTTLPTVTAGAGATIALTITGTGPFYLGTASGTPPTGTSYSGSSIVIPSSVTAGSYTWTVRATGPTGLTATQAYTLTVISSTAAPVITTATLPYATISVAYSTSLSATGTAPITWSITNGGLPTGLSLNASTGAITGTPSAIGSSQFVARASNASGAATATLTLTVVAASTSSVASPWAAIIRRS